jgi:adenine-specific DNA-methyltransferase
MAKKSTPKTVDAFKHEDEKRKNIPTAEYEPIVRDAEKETIRLAYERRNHDLDPQLVWRGKDSQDLSDLVVNAPPIYIQEKVHPKALVDALLRESGEISHAAGETTADLFADFNGVPKGVDRTEFYQHEQSWTNRLILGDSLQGMASLAEREGLRGKVQCIYFDPPYGIKFNSNFQWSTTSRDVKDGKSEHITREPEQVKAFRDTWRDGIHSYLTYLRDRLVVARDLLSPTGSIFVQISDENIHRVRALLDETFGEENYVSSILYRTTGGFSTKGLSRIGDNILWYAKDLSIAKFRRLCTQKSPLEDQNYRMIEDRQLRSTPLSSEQQAGTTPIPPGTRVWRYDNSTGQGAVGSDTPIEVDGVVYHPPKNTHWKASYPLGMQRLNRAARLVAGGKTVSYKRYFDDYSVKPLTATWMDTGVSGFAADKLYVVQTLPEVVQRCILMTTDPGDLVLDPTCGSGTTSVVAEQWGRRWISFDTSRVALTLARARIMATRFPYYLLADSADGQAKEAELGGTTPRSQPTQGNIRHGFVYERVPHIMLSTIANNSEIDVIWERWQSSLEAIRDELNTALQTNWKEWEIPENIDRRWSDHAKRLHADWWKARVARQKEIDRSIASKADFEYIYDKPYEDKRKVRVAGPFTVESLSPHRMLTVGVDDEVILNKVADGGEEYGAVQSFTQLILENLRVAGVQQAHKGDGIKFSSVLPYPGGGYICAVGTYEDVGDGDSIHRKVGIFIGPEFGTVSRPDLVAAAREAADNGFDVLVACAFNYEAHTTEFNSLGKVRVLKARMNADLHMAEDLKATGKGNLFVVFGEPDIELSKQTDGRFVVKVLGVDVFHPQSGEVRSDGPDGIACWMIDTDYNEESFFVRHAYFLGANDPYSALKSSLKAEINAEAWATLNSDTSRPFDKPKSGRIAVKVINHLGDEVMKVFAVN